MHKFLFYNKFYHIPLHVSSTIVLIIRRSKLATYRCDDTRCCI